MNAQRERLLLLSCQALAKLVRAEYPPYALTRIASTWRSNITDAELLALEAIENELSETGLELLDGSAESREIEASEIGN